MLLFVVCIFVVEYLLCVACFELLGVRCLIIVVCWLLFVLFCVLFW